jgi:hypothetical protein
MAQTVPAAFAAPMRELAGTPPVAGGETHQEPPAARSALAAQAK